MKQTSRKSSNLSGSLQRQLNAYALAASAAGVAVLALAQPAESKIVYTKTHHVIGAGGTYHLSLDHKGTDFVIYEQGNPFSGPNHLQVEGLGDNAVQGSYATANSPRAAALHKGSAVSSKRAFLGNKKGAVMAEFTCSGTCGFLGGSWAPWMNPNGYLGLKFQIDKKFHYGWAHVIVRFPTRMFINATVTGYAYETIPNKPIIAGKTKGPDVITLEPNSLGALAAGHRGRSQ